MSVARLVVHPAIYKKRVTNTAQSWSAWMPASASIAPNQTLAVLKTSQSEPGELDGWYAYLPVSNEGDAPASDVSASIEYRSVLGDVLVAVQGRWAGNDYPNPAIQMTKHRTVNIPANGEKFPLDTVWVPAHDLPAASRAYDYDGRRPSITDSEFLARVTFRYGGQAFPHDFTVARRDGQPRIEPAAA